jgi:hypothetical protein
MSQQLPWMAPLRVQIYSVGCFLTFGIASGRPTLRLECIDGVDGAISTMLTWSRAGWLSDRIHSKDVLSVMMALCGYIFLNKPMAVHW